MKKGRRVAWLIWQDAQTMRPQSWRQVYIGPKSWGVHKIDARRATPGLTGDTCLAVGIVGQGLEGRARRLQKRHHR